MKGFLSKLGQKIGEAADSIASYNTVEQSSASRGGVSSTAGGPRAAGSRVDHAPHPVPHDPGVLDHLMRHVRSPDERSAFYSLSSHPEFAYTESKDVRVLVGSYNVNGKAPPADIDMAAWLGLWRGDWPPGSQGDPSLPDVVVMGFQEIVPLNAENVIVGSATANLEGWDRAIGTYLNGETWAAATYGASTAAAASADHVLEALERNWSGDMGAAGGTGTAGGGGGHKGASGSAVGTWVQVAGKQLVGNYLSVWVRRSLLPHVRGVQAVHTMTGFGGYLGNKGAVVVRMRVYDNPLLVVCSHLSAGTQEGDELRRNNDVAEILRRTDFNTLGAGPGAMAVPGLSLLCGQLGAGHWGPINSITDHGTAIWLGDLNYRLVPSLISDDEARKALRAGRLQPLLDTDQLLREMAAGRVFQGWREGPVTFPPTFKFKVGTHIYLGEDGDVSTGGATDPTEDPSVSGAEKQKRRTPAWCDRVLWLASNPHNRLHQLAYLRAELTASDHKPVAAAFLLQALHFDRPKVDLALREAKRIVDMRTNMLRPKCALSPTEVMVPHCLRHGEVWRTTVKLVNTGPVEGLWHFVPPPSQRVLDEDEPALPPWLTACPNEGIIAPGGEMEVALEVCVRGGKGGAAAAVVAADSTCNDPTQAQAKLDTIVILKVENGGDWFLSVIGRYQASFLGQPLDELQKRQPQPPAKTGQGDLDALIASGCGGLQAVSTVLSLHKRTRARTAGLTDVGEGFAGAAALLVPEPWRRLLGLLAAVPPSTPGLFTTSAAVLLQAAAAGTSTSNTETAASSSASQLVSRNKQLQLMQLLGPVWQALDDAAAGPEAVAAAAAGLAEAGSRGEQALAAMLCVALLELPSSLLPAQVHELCNTQDPTLSMVDRLLAHQLTAAELAVLAAVLGLLARLPTARRSHTGASVAAVRTGPLAPEPAPGGSVTASTATSTTSTTHRALTDLMEVVLLGHVTEMGKKQSAVEVVAEAGYRRRVLCSLLLESVSVKKA